LDEKNLKEENISKNTRTNADIIDYLRSLGFSVKYSINKNGIVFVAVSIKKEQFKKLAIKSKEWHL
jgi:DNA/RNA endonuclease G (NUC1)